MQKTGMKQVANKAQAQLSEEHINSILSSAFRLLVYCLAYSSTVKMEAIPHLKRRLTFNGLHGMLSQKIELFIIKAVRTSDSTRKGYTTLWAVPSKWGCHKETRFNVRE
jgi:hypothetical protein